jgi:hypothetical protein
MYKFCFPHWLVEHEKTEELLVNQAQELWYTFWVKLDLSSHSYRNFHLQFQNDNIQQRKTES